MRLSFVADENWSYTENSNLTTILKNSNRVTWVFSKHFTSCFVCKCMTEAGQRVTQWFGNFLVGVWALLEKSEEELEG